MYYFLPIQICFFSVDATNISCYEKYVNDSSERFSNASVKRKIVDGKIHLCLFAKVDIDERTEIRYFFKKIINLFGDLSITRWFLYFYY